MKNFLFLLAPLFIISANLASEEAEKKSPQVMRLTKEYLNSQGGRIQYKDILKIANDTIDAKDAERKAKEAASETESDEKASEEEDKE